MSFSFGAAAGAAPSASSSSSSSSHSRDEPSHRQSIKQPKGGGGIQTLKRAQVFAELNKARRAENFNKRRRGHEALDQAQEAKSEAKPAAMSEAEVKVLLDAFRAAYVISTSAAAPSAIPAAHVPATERGRLLRQLRLLLSNDDAPVAAVVNAGVIPCLIAELGAQASPSTSAAAALADPSGASSQLDAIWCLTNIASDTTAHTRAVLPAAPALISFLSSASLRVQEQCVWCLGNLASEEQECRRQLLDNGILVPLIRLLQQACPAQPPPAPAIVPAPTDPAQLALVRVVSWALSNLIKTSRSAAKAAAGAGAAPDDVQRHLAAFAAAAPQLLPLLFTLLRSSDEQLAMETTWIVAAWAHHGEAVLTSLVAGGLLPALIARMYILRNSPVAQGPAAELDPATGIMRDPLAASLIPLVRVLGNLAHAQDAMVQQLLSVELPPPASVAGAATPAAAVPSAFVLVFSTLERSLLSVHRGLKKETCWVLSNLAATGVQSVHSALVLNDRGEAGVFVHALFRLMRESSFDVKREAGHALYNMCRMGDGHFLPILMPRVPPNDAVAAAASPTVLLLREFCDFLKTPDAEAILIALRILELVLSVHPDGVRLVEREGGIDALEQVQRSTEQAQLVDYAHKLVDQYFGVEDEDDDEVSEADDAQGRAQDGDLPAWRVQQQTPPRPLNNNQQQAPPTGGFQF